MQNQPHPNSLLKVTIITSTAALEGFTAQAANCPWLAVDTEFMRRNTYFPQLCIVQLALPSGRAAIVDTLAAIDLKPLWRLMDNTQVVKVFHAPGQDLEAFYRAAADYGEEYLPRPLFDTQIAAELGGYGKSLGLGALVKKISDLDEGENMCVSDWSRRPISAAQVEYALNDVRFVREAYLHLAAKLAASNELATARTKSDEITKTVLLGLDPKTAAERLAKRRRINFAKWSPDGRKIFERLAYWRETEAVRKNLPRQWIVKDDVLCKAADRLPKNKRELSTLCNAPPNFVGSFYAKRLLEQVASARQSA